MPSQLSLVYNDRHLDVQEYEDIREQVIRVVNHAGHKEACFGLDVSPSLLSNALAGRDRHHLWMKWIPRLRRLDNTDGLAQVLAGPAYKPLARKEELTPTQRLARLESALSEWPDEVKRAVYKSAGLDP